jgi:hypothetical protein
MNVLDENIAGEQRELLKSWHVRVHQVGNDIGRAGMQDEDIVPLLLQLRRSTFFTRDLDFYKRGLCHARYSIVYMNVEPVEVAAFVRRLLRHPMFDTEAKRMGTIIRVAYVGLTLWRLHAQEDERCNWVL